MSVNRPPEATAGIVLTREHRIMGAVLLAVPLTIVSAWQGWATAIQFFLSVVSVIPLAAFIGGATEALADKLGGKIGGLLNATFGNAPDLLVGVFGVQKGLIVLVKATLIGALISNSALIMGLCAIGAGLIFRDPRFKRAEAGHHSVLIMLAFAAVLLPSAGQIVLCNGIQCKSGTDLSTIMDVSLGISAILLLSYIAYVIYGIFGLESLARQEPQGREGRYLKERPVQGEYIWPTWFSIGVLALSTLCLIPITDILTGNVDQVTRVLHWSQVFVGIVIVANAGNVAEGYAAIKLALSKPPRPEESETGDSGLDLSLGIASASSIQIATFVAPLIVLYSLTGHHMTLAFSPIEIAILGLLVIIFAYIAQDGETNWLEGVQLVALYAMAAVIFYTLPPGAFIS